MIQSPMDTKTNDATKKFHNPRRLAMEMHSALSSSPATSF